MHFEKIDEFKNLEMSYICDFSGGYISRNRTLFENIELTGINQFILEKSLYGTPVFKMNGGSTKILILSGIHGNELPSQAANLKLMGEMIGRDLNATLYFIPFAAPKSTMNNERTFNSMDLNRSVHIKNSLSNLILKCVLDMGIDFVGDFHSTALNSNPGIESVFSSKSPSPESFLMANYVAGSVGCDVISFDFAGSTYKGAVEDICNLKGVPSVTCEVLCPFGNLSSGSVGRSYLQMKSFLDYFGV